MRVASLLLVAALIPGTIAAQEIEDGIDRYELIYNRAVTLEVIAGEHVTAETYLHVMRNLRVIKRRAKRGENPNRIRRMAFQLTKDFGSYSKLPETRIEAFSIVILALEIVGRD